MEARWDRRFLQLALEIAGWSKDTSSRFGCVIVGPDKQIRATGFNGIPRGVEDDWETHPERYTRPRKYHWSEHAERNAIYNAARDGVSLAGSTLYVNGRPCADCARAIIQTGIVRVVCCRGSNDYEERWEEITKDAETMCKEAGVEYVCLDVMQPVDA